MGIDWDSGDACTYFIEIDNHQVLTQSNVRPYKSVTSHPSTSRNPDSGETAEHPQAVDPGSNIETSDGDDNGVIPPESMKEKKSTLVQMKDMAGTGELDDSSNPSLTRDNESVDGKDDDDPKIDDFFTNVDAQQIDQEVQDIILADEEDYEFHSIKGHEWVAGVLVLKVELTSGHNIEVPFPLLKKDRPLELARYIRNNVVEQKRGGTYELWSKKIIQSANRTVRRMRHYHNIGRIIMRRKMEP